MIRNFINTNGISEDQSINNNNSNWLFSKTSNTADTNPRMYVLKQYADDVEIPDNTAFTQNPETFEWKFKNYYRTLEDEEFLFEDYQQK